MRNRLLLGAVLAGLVLAGAAASGAHAYTSVGTAYPLIVVDNGPGAQIDPHVSGRYAAYAQPLPGPSTVEYFDFDTGTNGTVPTATGATDSLPDVSGDTIAFTRLTPNGPSIYSYPIGGTPAEVAPALTGATWIWAPGITGATAPAELAQFFFTKSLTLSAQPAAATLYLAADDFAEVRVNGTVVGSTGSTTDASVAQVAANSLKAFNIQPQLIAGANTITIRAQNGSGAFAACTNCAYQQHPAGILIGGSITVGGGPLTIASDTSWQAFAGEPAAGATGLGAAQNVCLSEAAPVNCPPGATVYGTSGGGWTAGQPKRQNPAIAGNTFAWEDRGFSTTAEIVVSSGGATMLLTNDSAADGNPSVSPDESAIVWQKCSAPSGCDIAAATKSGGSWSVSQVTATPDNETLADTNGTLVVYQRADAAGNTHVSFKPLSGDAERVIAMPPGWTAEFRPAISGDFIVFEAFDGAQLDIWAYDIAADALRQITNTPAANEFQADVNAVPSGSTTTVTVVWQVNEAGDRNIYATRFSTDVEAPSIVVPTNRVVDATSPIGAVVTFSPTATDEIDPNPVVSCAPASGTTFAIGLTTVTCTATDASGNSAQASFTVTVKGAAQQILDLIDKTLAFMDQPQLEATLKAQLEAVVAALVANRPTVVCGLLNAYMVAVRGAPARAGLTQAEKIELVGDATRIKAVVGCP